MRTKRIPVLALIALMVMTMLFGCTKKELYRVEYANKGAFIDAKDTYAAGERVELKTYIVMDASPTVTVDGERLSPRVDGYDYLVYTFTMPAHDVKVEFSLGGSDMMAMRYQIVYEGGKLQFQDPQEWAYPGETVTLMLHPVFDKITEVFVNGEPVQQVSGPDSDLLYFSFVMPTEDVTVTVTSRNISAVEPVLKVDYYTKTVATDPGDGEEEGYYELVLYDDGEEKLLLEEYVNGGTADERVTRYRVPKNIWNEAQLIIYDAGMDGWSSLKYPESLDGALYVVRFDAHGTQCRVSSEAMPENGMDAFNALYWLLSGCLKPENLA
jgi:hypothetical protein